VTAFGQNRPCGAHCERVRGPRHDPGDRRKRGARRGGQNRRSAYAKAGPLSSLFPARPTRSTRQLAAGLGARAAQLHGKEKWRGMRLSGGEAADRCEPWARRG
jgi:hypothetical protein